MRVDDGVVVFAADPNETGEERRSALTLEYPEAEPLRVVVRQLAAEQPEEPEPAEPDFDLRIVTAAVDHVVVDCTPSDPESTYTLGVIRQSEYDEYGSDEALMQADAEYVAEHPETLLSGTVEGSEFPILFQNEPYLFYAFGVEADGTIVSERIVSLAFTSPSRPVITVGTLQRIPVSGGTFSVSYAVEHPVEGAAIEVTPSPDDWLHDYVVEPDRVVFVVDPNTSAEPGDEPRSSHFTLGYPDAYNAAVIVEQEAPAELVRVSFEATIVSVASSEVVVDCTPSDPEATYVAQVLSRSEYDSYGSDEALIASDIEYFTSPGWDGTPGSIADHLETGSFAGRPYSFFGTEREYYFLVYGLNDDGTVTSDGVYKIPFTAPMKPQIEADVPPRIPAEGGTFTIGYRIVHPVEGATIEVAPVYGSDWIHSFSVTDSQITFTVDPNNAVEPDDDDRSGAFTISYPDAYNHSVVVRQAAPSAE